MLPPCARCDDRGPRPHSSHWGAFSAWQDGDELWCGAILTIPIRRRCGQHSGLRPSSCAAGAAAGAGGVAGTRTRRRPHAAGAIATLRWSGRKCWIGLGPSCGASMIVTVQARSTAVRYGWSSAGRFHHAQSQVHRFLNTLGVMYGR